MRAIPPTLKVSLSFGRSRAHDHADASHPLGLLRPRAERRPRRGAEQVLADIHEWIAVDPERIAAALEIDAPAGGKE